MPAVRQSLRKVCERPGVWLLEIACQLPRARADSRAGIKSCHKRRASSHRARRQSQRRAAGKGRRMVTTREKKRRRTSERTYLRSKLFAEQLEPRTLLAFDASPAPAQA